MKLMLWAGMLTCLELAHMPDTWKFVELAEISKRHMFLWRHTWPNKHETGREKVLTTCTNMHNTCEEIMTFVRIHRWTTTPRVVFCLLSGTECVRTRTRKNLKRSSGTSEGGRFNAQSWAFMVHMWDVSEPYWLGEWDNVAAWWPFGHPDKTWWLQMTKATKRFVAAFWFCLPLSWYCSQPFT